MLTVRGHQEAQHLADSYIRGGNRLIFHVFRLQKPELTSGLPARTRRPFKPPRMTLPERKLPSETDLVRFEGTSGNKGIFLYLFFDPCNVG